MKEMTKYSRVAGYLEKLFDMLNADLFDGELERPIITLIPSSRSYGHYVPTPIWSIQGLIAFVQLEHIGLTVLFAIFVGSIAVSFFESIDIIARV